MSDWIQNVDKEMEKKGTKGSFTKQAKKKGMSVKDFAMEVTNNPSEYSETTRKRGQFALNMQKIAKKKKMAKGGETETQGFNDKLNEDLGSRLGRESGYSQSLKDRRDESKAGNKTLGRRAYSSVVTMDKGDKMFAKGEFVKPLSKKYFNTLNTATNQSIAKGGKTTQRKYYTYDIKGDKVHIYQQNKEDENSFDSIEQIITQLKNEGYKEKDFVVLKKDGSFARGGSVKGKIDRDRYVKLRRDKDKAIAKLKKEKGALRKETITKDKCDEKIETRLEGESNAIKFKKGREDNNSGELTLLALIGGIFFGAYFSK
jgi:hypothetical protein